ncbi:hypothetical protein FKN11_24425 [Vibrio sp. 2-2(7)]|uniref:hypothetical protein n=1 Tax=Vibrio sp. 2-2(7) TaxID=2591013 RepID=UPI00148399C9|nr:hypothetical protein [Vibrio sp. 2-2(7)]NNN54567.1 hypothetical protein [Vibrio sp. 2-2(7)]
MAIKITEQNKLIVVRRWKYSPERKRSLPTQVYSTNKYVPDEQLPLDVIKQHQITDEEHQTYIDYVAKVKQKQDEQSAKWSLSSLTSSLNRAKQALVDPELKETLSVEEYEELSETVNEIKKLITKNKNTLKRKEARSST